MKPGRKPTVGREVALLLVEGNSAPPWSAPRPRAEPLTANGNRAVAPADRSPRLVTGGRVATTRSVSPLPPPRRAAAVPKSSFFGLVGNHPRPLLCGKARRFSIYCVTWDDSGRLSHGNRSRPRKAGGAPCSHRAPPVCVVGHARLCLRGRGWKHDSPWVPGVKQTVWKGGQA